MTTREWKEYVSPSPRRRAYDENPDHLTPKQILDTIARLCPDGDTIVATDVGQHQMWCHPALPLLTTRASCSPPAASAPWASAWGRPSGPSVGNPDKAVIHIAGDGCFRMNSHELSTEEHYNTPVITVVFNNRTGWAWSASGRS